MLPNGQSDNDTFTADLTQQIFTGCDIHSGYSLQLTLTRITKLV